MLQVTYFIDEVSLAQSLPATAFDCVMKKIYDWIEGRLSEDEAFEMAARIKQEPELVLKAGWICRILRDTRSFRLVDLPQELRPMLKCLFDDGSAGEPSCF